MTYQRDPNDPMPVERRAGIREEDSWSVFPAVLGVVFLLLVGLIAYNMYNGSTTGPTSVNPSAQAPITTTPPAKMPPADNPTAVTPPPSPATPPAQQ
jgi:hypothetical protein